MIMNILIDNFLGAFGLLSAFAVWGLIAFIVIGVIATKFGDKVEDKKDEFFCTYQDTKCFNFAYDTGNSYQQVRISKDKLRTLIEDKKIDLLYEEESK